MEAEIGLLILVFFIGFVGSLLSGMLGIGGTIIKYPMLLYIPPLLGFVAFTAHEVAAISAVQVMFASISGVLVYRKGGFLNKELIIFMGISILLGSFLGGFGSKYMAESGINLIYAILATIAAVMMFVPRKGLDDVDFQRVTFNRTLASILAFIVGIGAGIVGAGGAFLLVPLMLVVLKIPTRMTIATSLAITFIASIGSAFGKLSTGQVDYLPAIIMIVASIIAAPIGAMIGKRMNTKVLRTILAVLILATAVKIWTEMF